MDSFKLLVEKSSQECARGVLNSLKMKNTEQKDPVECVSRNGFKIKDEAQLKKCAAGARRR